MFTSADGYQLEDGATVYFTFDGPQTGTVRDPGWGDSYVEAENIYGDGGTYRFDLDDPNGPDFYIKEENDRQVHVPGEDPRPQYQSATAATSRSSVTAAFPATTLRAVTSAANAPPTATDTPRHGTMDSRQAAEPSQIQP